MIKHPNQYNKKPPKDDNGNLLGCPNCENNNITKTTFVLLVDSLDKVSTKIIKAKKYNIPIMTHNSFINEYSPNRTSTGIPKYYASWDNNTIIVAPAPNAAYTVELAYNAQPTGLSSSNTTTWVSLNAPRALLYASLVEAFKFLKGPDNMLAIYEQSFNDAVKTLATEQMGRRRRDEYRDGALRMPIPSVNP